MPVDVSKEIRKLLIEEDKTLIWLSDKLETSQSNLSKKLKRNNFCTNDMQDIAEALGYDLKIEFIKKEN
ncbi:transcriptional regulator [Clostridium butyricum]|nr:transcriptional regulator [Clostridium butyricum]MDU3581170.1 transcriptional regulator [Clostridium butyricum]MDU3594732.1 transcriptional regulator [Clostridium butyricum]